MKKPRFQTVTGMHDILPDDQIYFQKISETVSRIAEFYGFGKIDTPTLEAAEIFTKGIGMSTDIVEKQMYSFRTKGGDIVTLRPEGTAPVARAYIQHGMFNLPQPVKLWYLGPFFRYEHPQAGRYRQFHQFGFEALGEDSPAVDAQIMNVIFVILQELKIKDIIFEINSIGDSQCRPYYKKTLASYFKPRLQSLCIDCRRRLRENPLRILDCKEEKCQRIKVQAPQMVDHLCEICHDRFKEVLEFLDDVGIPYTLNPFLVRGLDYYTKTVFEVYEKSGAGYEVGRGAIAGGGRYDNLIKILGGRSAPACGVAAGVERIINILKQRGIKASAGPGTQVFLAQLGILAKRKSIKILENFRKAKINVAESLGKDSLKTQLGRADRIGVAYTMIFGQKEALEGTIIIREMASGQQETVKLEKAAEVIKKRLQK